MSKRKQAKNAKQQQQQQLLQTSDSSNDVGALLLDMESNLTDPDVQMAGAQRIKELFARNAPKLSAKETPKIVPALLDAMKAHQDKAGLLGELMSVLSTFCRQLGSGGCEVFIKEGGAEAVIAAMTRFSESSNLQLSACLLWNGIDKHILDLPPGTRRAAAYAILSALETHMHTTGILQMGFHVLSFWFGDCEDGELVNRCIRAAVESMRLHQDGTTQVLGCMALNKFSSCGDRNVAYMAANGAIATLLAGIVVLMRYESRGSEALTGHMIMECARSICLMCDMKGSIGDEQGVAVLPRVLVRYVHMAKVVNRVCKLIHIAAGRNATVRAMMSRPAVRAILLGMQTHKDDKDIQVVGMEALKSICEDHVANTMCVVEEDALRILLRRGEAHVRESDVRHAGVRLFSEMARTGRAQACMALLRAGSVRYLTQCMLAIGAQRPPCEVDEQTLNTGLLALHSIAQSNEPANSGQTAEEWAACQMRIVQEGAIDAFIRLMAALKRNWQPHILAACTIFVLITDRPDICKTHGLRLIRPAIECMLGCLSERAEMRLQVLVFKPMSEILRIILHHTCDTEIFARLQDEFRACGGFKALCGGMQLWLAANRDEPKTPSPTESTHAYAHQAPHDGSKKAAASAQPTAEQRMQLPNGLLKLAHLSALGHIRNQFHCVAEPGLADQILRLMARYDSDENVQRNGCAALFAVASDNATCADFILSKGGFEQASLARDTCKPTAETDLVMKLLGQLSLAKSGSLPRPEEPIPLDQAHGEDADHHADTHAQKGTRGDSTQSSAQSGVASGHRDKKSSRKTKTSEPCVVCGKTAEDVGASKLPRCSVCTLAPVYCSAACQHAAWPAHKTECKAHRKTSK
jgi:hypothetical protein